MSRRCWERGEAETAEFTLGVVPLVLLVMLIAAAAIARPAQLPVFFAAQACARAASVSVDPDIGLRQGIEAAADALRGNSLSATSASIRVWSDGAWQRGEPVTCQVRYDIDLSGLPMVGAAFGVIPAEARVTTRIEPAKSRWGGDGP